jgi:hypothetical protein
LDAKARSERRFQIGDDGQVRRDALRRHPSPLDGGLSTAHVLRIVAGLDT